MYEVGYKITAQDEISKVFRSIHRLDVKTTKGIAGLGSTFKKTSGVGVSSLRKITGGFVRVERRAIGTAKSMYDGFKKWTDKLGPLGKMVGGYFAWTQVKALALGTINAASDLQESTSYAQVQFGENFNMISKFAKNARNEIGESQNVALTAATKFGNLFSNVGFGSKLTAGMSEELTRVAADIGSAQNKSFLEVRDALFSGLRGETEPLGGLGIILNQATLKDKALAMGLIKNTKAALTPRIKVMATYATILEKSDKSLGDFARTSNGFANRQKQLSAGWIDLSAKMGTVFLPYAEKVQAWGLRALEWIDQNGAKIKSWGSTILSATKWLGGFYVVMKTATIGLGIYDAALKVGGIWSLIKGLKVARIGMIAFNFVASMSPFGWIALAIGGIYLLYKNFDNFKIWFDVLAQKMWENHPFKWMIDVIDNLIPGFKDSMGKMWTDVKDMFFKGIGWIKDKLMGFADFLGLDSLFSIEDPTGGTNRGSAFNRNKDKGYEYGKLNLGGSGGLGAGPQGSSIKERMSGMVTGAGKEVKNIVINIDKLVESLIIQSQTIGMSTGQIKSEMSKVLLTAVNDANYS